MLVGRPAGEPARAAAPAGIVPGSPRRGVALGGSRVRPGVFYELRGLALERIALREQALLAFRDEREVAQLHEAVVGLPARLGRRHPLRAIEAPQVERDRIAAQRLV